MGHPAYHCAGISIQAPLDICERKLHYEFDMKELLTKKSFSLLFPAVSDGNCCNQKTDDKSCVIIGFSRQQNTADCVDVQDNHKYTERHILYIPHKRLLYPFLKKVILTIISYFTQRIQYCFFDENRVKYRCIVTADK